MSELTYGTTGLFILTVGLYLVIVSSNMVFYKNYCQFFIAAGAVELHTAGIEPFSFNVSGAGEVLFEACNLIFLTCNAGDSRLFIITIDSTSGVRLLTLANCNTSDSRLYILNVVCASYMKLCTVTPMYPRFTLCLFTLCFIVDIIWLIC